MALLLRRELEWSRYTSTHHLLTIISFFRLLVRLDCLLLVEPVDGASGGVSVTELPHGGEHKTLKRQILKRFHHPLSQEGIITRESPMAEWYAIWEAALAPALDMARQG